MKRRFQHFIAVLAAVALLFTNLPKIPLVSGAEVSDDKGYYYEDADAEESLEAEVTDGEEEAADAEIGEETEDEAVETEDEALEMEDEALEANEDAEEDFTPPPRPMEQVKRLRR